MANFDELPNSKKVKRSVRIQQHIIRKSLRQNPPDLCMDAIYRHIPLVRLLLGSTQLISKSWHEARTRALAERRTLYLIRDDDEDEMSNLWHSAPQRYKLGEYIEREDGSPMFDYDSLDNFEFDVVYLPTARFTVKFTSFLLNHLPKITHLAVQTKGGHTNTSTHEIEQIIRLLEHHSAHLIKFHLILRDQFGQTSEPQAITRLFETINRLEVLEHLKLNLYFTVEHERPPLTILSRLTSFSIDSNVTLHYVNDGADWLGSSLRHYADRNRLRSIGAQGLELEQLAQLHPQIVGKFNWLEVSDAEDEIEYAEILQLFGRFNSLTCLELQTNVSSLPLNMLTRCLAQVPSLIVLQLWISDATTESEQPNEAEPIRSYQLPSVLALSLHIELESHEDANKLNIADTFPHLQVVEIRHEVKQCRSCPFNRKMATFERVVQCRRLARETMLAGCNNLRRIIYQSEDPNNEYFNYHEIRFVI